jgi:formylglycine-generating enzyme required for sulfatase activity
MNPDNPQSPFPDLPLHEFEYEFPVLDSAGRVTERHSGRGWEWIQDLDSGVTLEMIAIPGGMFQMGSTHLSDPSEETPQHLVSVKSFFLARGLITQEQWNQVVGKPLPCRFIGPHLPVENVTWREAVTFCKKLARLAGGPDYRLPSESEWEYACRAGTGTPFSSGATLTTDLANFCGPHTYKAEPPGLYRHKSTPSGTFPPNPFGLYDMHANLWEWCADGWHADYSGAPLDGSAWENGAEPGARVTRGGSWHEPPANCRSSSRLRQNETERDDLTGFRVAFSRW